MSFGRLFHERVAVGPAAILHRAHRAQERDRPDLPELPGGPRLRLEGVDVGVRPGHVARLHQREDQPEPRAQERGAIAQRRGDPDGVTIELHPFGNEVRFAESRPRASQDLQERRVVAERARLRHGVEAHPSDRRGIRRRLETGREARARTDAELLEIQPGRRMTVEPLERLFEETAHRRIRVPCGELGAIGERGAREERVVLEGARGLGDAERTCPAAGEIAEPHARAPEEQAQLRCTRLVFARLECGERPLDERHGVLVGTCA